MKFSYLREIEKRKEAEVLVLPYWKDKQGIKEACFLKGEWSQILVPVLETQDFRGKEGETLFLYVKGQVEKRFCLLGLGAKDKATIESFRRSYGELTKSCLSKRLKSLNLIIPQVEEIDKENLIKGIAEGLFLPNYIFDRYKKADPEEPNGTLLQEVTWIGSQQEDLKIVKTVFTICKAVNYVRDLVNENADDVTPQYLVQCAKEIAHKYSSVKLTVFDKKRIEKEKMKLLLAVNRGSALDPAFIIMEYQGNPRCDDKTILIGKGITYDTGGLNLKPTGGIETMKCDMAGGAVCLGVISAVSQLKLKVNLTIVIPSTENGIDAKSFKPGDVYQSYLGKTVEMTNSDAEGRLILADALAYAIKNLRPTRLIDIATLTGAIEIALGSEAAGLMSNNDELAQMLQEAGNSTFERLWRMPLFEEYKEKLKSDIADLKSWNGKSASSSVAATFLGQFIEDSIPWAHIDIAGLAYVSEVKRYSSKFATGYGVRLMVEFLQRLEKD